MDQTETQTEERVPGAFDEILGIRPGAGKQAQEKDAGISLKDLQERLTLQDEAIKKLTEQNSGLVEQLKTVDRIQKALSPDEGDPSKLRVKLAKEFDRDPLSFLDNVVEHKVGQVKKELDATRNELAAERAMSELDKDYVINWDRDYQKIVSHLQNFNQEYIQKNSKEAILKAARLAGVVKRRASGKAPFIEGSDIYSAQMAKKAKDEAEQYKARILSTSGVDDKVDKLFKSL